jgi:hypothetical protein
MFGFCFSIEIYNAPDLRALAFDKFFGMRQPLAYVEKNIEFK